MSDKKKHKRDLLEIEGPASRDHVARFLRNLADAMDNGRVTLSHGEQSVMIDVPERLELEVEVEEKDKAERGLKRSVEIELTWYETAQPA